MRWFLVSMLVIAIAGSVAAAMSVLAFPLMIGAIAGWAADRFFAAAEWYEGVG